MPLQQLSVKFRLYVIGVDTKAPTPPTPAGPAFAPSANGADNESYS
jgi:hypothetical protein